MTILGVPLGTVFRLAREARDVGTPGQLLVIGPLAPQLARLLVAEGGDRALVHVGGANPAGAAAVVCVLAGAPTAEQVAVLRSAARAGVPTVGVQTGDPAAAVPYVLAGDVVHCPPGQGFPVEEIAAALCRCLGRSAAPLAARLPALREAAARALTTRAVVTAAGLAAPWAPRRHLPTLVPLQARMLRDLAVASGSPTPVTQEELGAAVGPELGVPLVVGVVARTLLRRLPRRRAIDASVAGGVTLALAALARGLR